MPTRSNVWIVEAFKRLREAYGGKCAICGSSERLEFAHVRPTSLMGRGRGRKERYYDVSNNPECYMLLCHDCHRDHDDELDALEESDAPLEAG